MGCLERLLECLRATLGKFHFASQRFREQAVLRIALGCCHHSCASFARKTRCEHIGLRGEGERARAGADAVRAVMR